MGVVLGIRVDCRPVAVLGVYRDLEVIDYGNHAVDCGIAALVILGGVDHGVHDNPLIGLVSPSDVQVVIAVDADVGVPCTMCSGVGYLGLGNQHVTPRVVHLVPQVLGVAAPDEVHIAHRVGVGSHHLVVRRASVDYLNRVSQYHLTGLSPRDLYRRERAHHHQ